MSDEEALLIIQDCSVGQLHIFEPEYDRDDHALNQRDHLLEAVKHIKTYSDLGSVISDSQLNTYGTWIAQEILDKTEEAQERKSEFRSQIRRAWPIKRPSKALPGYVYLLQSPTRAYKIGRSQNPSNRLKTFSIQLPFEVEFICTIKTPNMLVLESELHERFADKRINGEWFALSDEDVQYIKNLAEQSS